MLKRKTTMLLLLLLFVFAACAKVEKKTQQKDEAKTEKYCYIKKIDVAAEKVIVTIDPISYLKFSDLKSNISPDKIIKLPNGFCYFNEEEKYEKLELSNKATIVMQTFSFDEEGNFNFNQSVTAEQFITKFNDGEDLPFKFSPFKILTNGKTISKIEEIYIP